MTNRMCEVFAQFCQLGLWPGVGKALAGQLASAGITEPGQVSVAALSRLPRVRPVRAERLYSAWIGAQHSWQLAQLLASAELPLRWTSRLLEALGDGAAGVLSDDPWQLLVLGEVRVDQADSLARTILPTVHRHDVRRGRAVLSVLFRQAARDGHTYLGQHQALTELAAYGLAEQAITAALAAGTAAVLADAQNAEPLLASSTLLAAEQTITTRLAHLQQTARPLGTAARIKAASDDLDTVQAGAVAQLARSGVSILTGGPGTGKSRTVSAIVRFCQAHDIELALCAPTGRAAKRLAELAGHPASTIHRLLGARRTDGRSALFSYDANHRLPAQVLVVDEVSMVDVELGAALLDAIAPGTHLLLVGDPAQLASIGPGRMLADVLESGRFPVTELRTLYRHHQGGAIAALATAVRDGNLPAADAADHEVVIVPVSSGAEARHRVVQVVCQSLPRTFDLRDEAVQVVTPIHRGPAGTIALNSALKQALNPGPGQLAGFDVGDRVVATVNHLDAEPFGYANGEVGTVTAIDGRELTVTFPAGAAVVRGKDLADLRHGWAITVHRAQGSEWEAVVVVLPADGTGMLSRPLVYTALTRARRQLTIIHGAGAAVAHAVRRIGARPRRTLLPTLLAADAPGLAGPPCAAAQQP